VTAPLAREILFVTDFSDVSRRAGATAAGYARHFAARLHVLHVVPPSQDPEPEPRALREAAAELGPGLTTVLATSSGLVARQIVDYAARHRIDLIVMGTHGRTGFSHALLGSVAEAVVRRAPCPVLTVPAVAPAPVPTAAPAAPAREVCIVCGQHSADLICALCRAHIRGEALERKRAEEHGGHTR
jgi:universal stress protein A